MCVISNKDWKMLALVAFVATLHALGRLHKGLSLHAVRTRVSSLLAQRSNDNEKNKNRRSIDQPNFIGR